MVAQMDFPNEEPNDEQRAQLARDAQIEALRREHDGYVRYGHTERAEYVAGVLAELGEPLEDAAESAPRQRAVPKRGRS